MKIFLTKLEVGLSRKIFLTKLEVGWDMKIYRTKLEVGILPQSLHIYIPMWRPNVRRPDGGAAAPKSCLVPIAHPIPRHGSATFQRVLPAHPHSASHSVLWQRFLAAHPHSPESIVSRTHFNIVCQCIKVLGTRDVL